MSILSYVVNFDELVNMIAIEGTEINIDTKNIEDILGKFFPDILAILEKIKEQNIVEGIQKIKGFCSLGEVLEYRTEKDILITGITISQSIFNGCMDKWNIKVKSNDDNEFKILEDIYSKDSLQHKYFEKFYPIPQGYKLIIEPENTTNEDKAYWCDLEYLELI